MSNTYYTQVFTSDGSNKAYNVEADNAAPYVTYNCKNTVNLNFLLREVLFCDPESITVGSDDAFGTNRIHIVPTYNTELDAKSDTDGNRYSDVSNTHGHYYAMRLINALMRTQIDPSEQTTLDTYLKHYGGYKNGLSNGSSNNTSNPNTATMDFAEFFQVALSAVRNKETDAVTTGVNGLVDRENINNAAVNGDLNQRTVGNTSASSLLRTMIGSSRKLKTLTEGQIINDSSDVNWLKQLVYSIIQNTSTTKGGVGASEENERYRSIRRSGLTSNEQERFMQLKLQDGDSIVFTFIFNLSNADNTSFNNEQPDSPGTPITVGFRVQHSDTAAEFAASGDSILPIGWTDEYFTGLVMTLLFGIGSDAAALRQNNIDDGIANLTITPGIAGLSIIKADNTMRLIGQAELYVPYYWDELIGNNVTKVNVISYTADDTQFGVLYGTEGNRKIASWISGTYSDKRSSMGGCPVNIRNLTDVKDIFSFDYSKVVFTLPGHEQVAIHGANRQAIRWACNIFGGYDNNIMKVGGASVVTNVINIYPGTAAFAATVDNLNGTYDIVSFGSNVWGGSNTAWTVTARATGLSIATQSVKFFAKGMYSFLFYLEDKSIVGWVGSGGGSIATALSWGTLSLDFTHLVGLPTTDGFLAVTTEGDIRVSLLGQATSNSATSVWGSTPVTITKVVTSNDAVTILAATGKVVSYTYSGSYTGAAGAGKVLFSSSFIPGGNTAVDIMADGYLSLVKLSNGKCKIWGAPSLATEDPDITNTTKIIASGSNAAVLKSNGSVFFWTYNDDKGFASNRNNMVPKLTSGIIDIYKMSQGYGAIAVKSDNNLIHWGWNQFINNQDATIGNQEVVDILTTKGAFSLMGYCALLGNGTVRTWGSFSNGGKIDQPTWTGIDNTVALASGVTKVRGLTSGFVALKDDNKVYLWGDHYNQWVGFWNASISPLNVSDIFTTDTSFALLKTDNNVVAWSSTLASLTVTGISGNVSNIVTSQKNYCALLSTGTVSVFGTTATTYGGSTQLSGDATAPSFVASGITSVVGTRLGFIARKADGTAVYWGGNNSNFGVMTGIIDISSTDNTTSPIALNKSTTCYLVGASDMTTGTDLTRLQLKPITKAMAVSTVAGVVLHKDNTVDVWGTSFYAKYTANTNQLKNELNNIDFIATNNTSFVARRSTDNRLFIVVNSSFVADIITEENTALFIPGAVNSWYYVEDVIKVYSNKSVFIAVRSDYSTVIFGNYLDQGGYIPAGFDMSRAITQIPGVEGFQTTAVNRSFFLKYT
jgi:hypothetical protein